MRVTLLHCSIRTHFFLISFGEDQIGPPAFSCSRDETLVHNGAVAPKPCLSPPDMCTQTASGSLLPIGAASTATRIISYQPRSRLCPTEETSVARHHSNTRRTSASENRRSYKQIETISGIRSWRLYRSSTRLPIFVNVARVAL